MGKSSVYIFLLPFLILFGGFSGITSAQDQIDVRCGIQSSPDTPIAGFSGTFYHTTRIGVVDPDHIWEFGLIADDGQTLLQAPLSPEMAQHIILPRISPEGTKMVFSPFQSNEIVVWDILTGEVTSATISQDLADYLSHSDKSSELSFNKLLWGSSSELLLQYYSTEYPDINEPAYRLQFSVLENPLRIISPLNIASVELKTLDVQRSPTLYSILSPDENYRVDVQRHPDSLQGNDIQIYDTANDHRVFEATSSEHVRILGNPIWSFDQNYIFYLERVPDGIKLAQINAKDNFTRDFHLDRLLENQFGTTTGIASTFLPILSNDKTHWAFGYYDQRTNDYYMIRYDILSAEVVAICDDQPTSGNWYSFWSPSNRFAGYWYGGVVKIYDFETGNRFLLPGQSFAGWVK